VGAREEAANSRAIQEAAVIDNLRPAPLTGLKATRGRLPRLQGARRPSFYPTYGPFKGGPPPVPPGKGQLSLVPMLDVGGRGQEERRPTVTEASLPGMDDTPTPEVKRIQKGTSTTMEEPGEVEPAKPAEGVSGETKAKQKSNRGKRWSYGPLIAHR